MQLLHQFNAHWQQSFPNILPANARLLLAVSGGVDSVVLTDLVTKAGFSFIIAHVNFQLRGEESTRDEMFVRSLGKTYNCEVLINHADTKSYAAQNKMATQEAARVLRYTWFKELVEAKTADWILTAHHADDNIETVLLHFFRGTGVQGMTGIQPLQKERALLRPLLDFRKKELQDYAVENRLQFVEDSSNASDAYTRNFFRNTLLPQIKTVFPQAEENILNNLQRFSEVQQVYRQAIDEQLKKLVEPKASEWHIPILKWKKSQPLHTIIWELVKLYGFAASQTEEIIKLLDAQNGAYISSGTHRIIKNRNWMIISPTASNTAQHILIEEKDKNIRFEEGEIKFRSLGGEEMKINNSNNEAFIDSTDIKFPLLLRKWKQGDYFYPLGMVKKKKLSRFFIDQKLSKTAKEKVWVIESNKKIVWVIGYRIDNRYRITEKTKQVLHITQLR